MGKTFALAWTKVKPSWLYLSSSNITHTFSLSPLYTGDIFVFHTPTIWLLVLGHNKLLEIITVNKAWANVFPVFTFRPLCPFQLSFIDLCKLAIYYYIYACHEHDMMIKLMMMMRNANNYYILYRLIIELIMD